MYGLWKTYWILWRDSRERARALEALAEQGDLSGEVPVQSGDAAREGRLPRAGLAHEGQALLGLDGQAHVVQHLPFPIEALIPPPRRPRVPADGGELLGRFPSSRRLFEHVGACSSARRDARRHARREELLRAALDGVRAARLEEAPARPVPGTRSGTGYADERMVPRHLGNRFDQPARIRVRRPVVERLSRTELDDAARVHDRDAAREGSHDGQVVAHVEGRNAVDVAEVADGVEDVRLRRDVESRRRLVEDDHARAACESHRQADALLLAARELVWIACKETLVARKKHLVEHLGQSFAPLLREAPKS